MKGLVLLVAMLVAAGCGTDDPSPPATSTSATEPTTATTDTTPATTARCSSAGLDLQLPAQTGLPAEVAATRRLLFDAAMACDYDLLGKLANVAPKQFGYSFGEQAGGPVKYWRSIDSRDQTLARLAQLLTAPFVKVTQGPLVYAWPSVYQDAPSDADYAALRATHAYPDAQVAAFQKGGSYLGYRIGIKPDGTWTYFLQGD